MSLHADRTDHVNGADRTGRATDAGDVGDARNAKNPGRAQRQGRAEPADAQRPGWAAGSAGRPGRRGRLVLAVGAATAGVALLAGCGGDSAEDAKPEHRSFALDGRSLSIESNDSSLELVPADVKKVEVTRWFNGHVVLGESPKASWSMKGDRLSLRTHCTGLVHDCNVKHRIKVPRGVDVSVRGDDGSVHATGFHEALAVTTEDGLVTVRDSTGPLDLRSDDGALNVEGVRSKRISAHSKDGRVEIAPAAVPDRVNVATEDGAIEIVLPGKASYRVSATAVDGSVDVNVPRDRRSAHSVTARSTDGKVSVRSAN